MAGLLHDVARSVCPKACFKNRPPHAEEFDQMKKHPQNRGANSAGYQQIRDIIPGVLYHHERYDGRGYPEGRIGEDIPIMGELSASRIASTR